MKLPEKLNDPAQTKHRRIYEAVNKIIDYLSAKQECRKLCTNGKDTYHDWNINHAGICSSCGQEQNLKNLKSVCDSCYDGDHIQCSGEHCQCACNIAKKEGDLRFIATRSADEPTRVTTGALGGKGHYATPTGDEPIQITRYCASGQHSRTDGKMPKCNCHKEKFTTTSTGGETIYVKAPPFHRPAQAISQSVVEREWAKAFDEKFCRTNKETGKKEDRWFIADCIVARDVKSFIHTQIDLARKEALQEAIEAMPKINLANEHDQERQQVEIEGVNYCLHCIKATGADDYRTEAIKRLKVLMK